ncbi:MAG: hypothetical protein JOY71_22575 [Acetobacteraceae bacterium]|nr:hypothetical protein [Acetobacteraceae bacterium]
MARCQWELIGTEADACRKMLRKWTSILGQEFYPAKPGIDYLHGNLLRALNDEEVSLYESGMQCWVSTWTIQSQKLLSFGRNAFRVTGEGFDRNPIECS